jgi:hypothetical protein
MGCRLPAFFKHPAKDELTEECLNNAYWYCNGADQAHRSKIAFCLTMWVVRKPAKHWLKHPGYLSCHQSVSLP